MTTSKTISLGLGCTALALLAACTPQQTTTLADGSVAYRINCDATPSGLNFCFENAGKSCGADGYTIIGRDGETISTSRVARSDREAVVRAYLTNQNSILVKCGDS